MVVVEAPAAHQEVPVSSFVAVAEPAGWPWSSHVMEVSWS